MYYIYVHTCQTEVLRPFWGVINWLWGYTKKTLTRACWDDYNVMPQWNVWFIDLINCSFSHKPNGEIRVMPRNCYTTLSPIFNHHVWGFLFCCSVNPGLINHGLLIRGVRTLRHTRFLQEHCCYSEPLQGSQHRQLWGQIGAFGLRGDDFQRYHLVMTNIAMERPTMLLIGKAR